jgi:hypothetical protein
MFARRLFLAAAVAGLALPVFAQSLPSDISGSYKAEGRNPDGSTYTGRVTVQESVGGAVAFAWIVANQSYAGVGTRDGRVVSVDWGEAHPVVYVIMPGGALYGTWADGRALERLTK